ncbi:DUF3572 family protein [Sphingomonas sp. S2-65]|uniref:DUF3572 family protein n=1 Tax=Sphingomonas sp. S2-65 TaxID=2903960 RepID=UPI001F48C5DF|nr:DUF3572 family protein [Sphingomonas sp. S2-65]UYY60189.1 DUF3572 domain-containing protein [Sphingomonas sp. S2-65]
MAPAETNADALALQALVWTLGDSQRANRLLDLTGLTPEELRARIGDPALLAAAIGFLESYEPDLIACAAAIGATPAELVAARAALETA